MLMCMHCMNCKLLPVMLAFFDTYNYIMHKQHAQAMIPLVSASHIANDQISINSV